LAQILIIDDDPGLLRACSIGLEVFGHRVSTAEDGAEGIAAALADPPGAIVLDMGLPDVDGLDVCRQIRTRSDVPIVVLSADGSEDRKVEALDQGADDYMTKPFGMRELDARLRAALRHRAGPDEPDQIDVGSLHFDLVHREVTRAGARLEFTRKEFDILALLAVHAGKSCSRQMIMEEVWGPGYRSETHYLKVYAYRIRRKLDDANGQILRSDPAVGYRLTAPAT
jgi:two-component system KDP operon response regulator KdpE